MIYQYFDELDVEPIPRRYIRNMEDPFEKYNDNTFLKHYRFPKLIVMDQLANLLESVKKKSMDMLLLNYVLNVALKYICSNLWIYPKSTMCA
ncbi:putative nuclease HARBI1 [Aphis craccivora]|uniref:Putative nuclease HARBI1 n=1 Tax=Aphis craccivora TaxID=307492 RepID=A0A6G0W756_APHCR|nr:putative nuclease HARBI1 [Aphis craccivora]